MRNQTADGWITEVPIFGVMCFFAFVLGAVAYSYVTGAIQAQEPEQPVGWTIEAIADVPAPGDPAEALGVWAIGTAQHGLELSITAAQSLRLEIFDGLNMFPFDGLNMFPIVSERAISPGPHFIAAIYDDERATVSIFVDHEYWEVVALAVNPDLPTGEFIAGDMVDADATELTDFAKRIAEAVAEVRKYHAVFVSGGLTMEGEITLTELGQ